MPILDEPRDKALRLIDYLVAIARLRSKIIRDVKDYERVLWMHEIPREPKYCFTQAWGANQEYDQDIWIEIKKYAEPIPDQVPEICEQWVNNATLYKTDDFPELYKSINIQIREQNPDWNPESSEQEQFIVVTKTLQLTDYPEVSMAWEDFLDKKWIPWTELHKRWQSVQKVYTKLFNIHQDIQKLGEEYELILGIGFLTWRTPSGQSIRRHLISAKANLHFEARLGKFTITPSADGAQLAPELDMLTIEEQPLRAEQAAKDGLISSDDNTWDRSSIDPVLSALSNLLGNRGEGEYHANNLTPSQGTAQAKPIVDYAPALILRKRSAQGLESTLKKMREAIEAGDKIPPEFMSLCEERGERQNIDEHEVNTHIYNETDPTIYFPKPSNEQQRQIIQKLQSTTGVLVQGPPGTGKSHTIANLICHLLATGQRILVTAKTPRALQVLHKQLPPKVRPLCINLLGSSVDEQRSLEASVTGILSERDRWDDSNADEKIKQLSKEIKELKSEKAEINHRVRSIRESETFQQTVIDGKYSGTAAKIALKLKKESDEFNWFQDKIKYDLDAPPYSSEDLINLCSGIVAITPEIEAELMLEVPTTDNDLPPADILGNLMSQYFDTKTKYSEVESFLNSQIGKSIEKTELSAIYRIIESLSKLNVAVEKMRKRPIPWIKEAVHDMLIERVTPWKELFHALCRNLEGLKECVQKIDKQILSVPEGLNRKQLLTDAKNLKQHFDKGGKIGWGPLKPKIVRDLKYLIKEVKVDACPCDSSISLGMLIENLTIRQTIDHAWKLWEGKSARKTGPLFLQVAELEELHETLKSVIAISNILRIAKESLSVIQGLVEPEWHDSTAVANLLETCNAVIVNNDFRKISKELHQHVKKIETFANRPNAHAIAKKALTIIKNWNAEVYNKYLLEIANLNKRLAHAKWVKNTMNELSKFAPMLVAELSTEPNNQGWEVRLKQFEYAWAWARANSWLRDFLNKEDLPSLERRLKQIDNSIQTKLEELSAIRAWKFCFSRMGNHQRQHLIGWQRENKGTKGKGKYVHTHRRNAQAHFKECRDAVPAWIMPLHRVYETVAPSSGTFDVIIVDEASQCGPEALPLTYLAKRLLVVGDEHQISPEAVGVERSQIHRLMEEKLSDFEHADSFDVENSLFAHGKLRFNNRIVLREHFRCMPEIIVDAVVQCCNDERYDEKTMGVIILQGDAQAAHIENMLLEQLGAEEMEHRRLICGNPYSFQGDERHIIFLSMVAAPNERIGPFTKPADQRRFNVAASRAQDQMWLFHSVTLNDLSKDCLRRRLLEYFLNPTSIITKALGTEAEKLRRLAQTANRQIEDPPAPYDSWFEVDVALHIAAQGYRVIPQYPVLEKKRIDLVIESINGQQLAVECDGDYWHGAEQYEKDMERQRMLERCGWNFHRIRECAYYSNPNETMDALWQELYRHGIHSISETPIKKTSIGTNESNDDSPKKNQEIKETQFSYQGGDNKKQTDQNSESSKTLTLDNIQEALALKRAQLSQVIVETLKTRPNYSCVKEALTGLVLKQLGVISRGMPREAFARKVNYTLNFLKSESIVEIYKSKNVRVRLIKIDNYLF
jgi:very-short-patch-repair endonuclease